MTSLQVIRHEFRMSGKTTCFAFSIQTALQSLNLVVPGFPEGLWILTSCLIIFGVKSDAKFYAKNTDNPVKLIRFSFYFLMLLLSWFGILRLFHNLGIPQFKEDDKEMAEVALPGLEQRLLSSKILDDFGVITGMVLLPMRIDDNIVKLSRH